MPQFVQEYKNDLELKGTHHNDMYLARAGRTVNKMRNNAYHTIELKFYSDAHETSMNGLFVLENNLR